jgi:DNA-directed RNA polymerase specialized sigma24 family protein
MSTWLSARLRSGEAGRLDAGRHVMDVYAHPLRVYFLGSSFRALGDAEDMVNGFFADRLQRPHFLERWADSGRPLRYWLIVGFKHYLYETARAERRADAGQLAESINGDDSGPIRGFDREVGRALVAEAARRAEAQCLESNLAEHWDLFRRHFIDEAPFARVAPEFGVSPERAAVMARTAAHRFKRALRDMVAWEGATDEQVDQEIARLMEAVS